MTGSGPGRTSPIVIPVPAGHAYAYLVRGTRTILVDTGFPKSGPSILSALDKNGIHPRDISLIIITHAHIDHFGAAAFLKKATGAPVLVHAREAENLKNGMSRPPVPVTLMGRLMSVIIGMHSPVPDLAVIPDITIDAPFSLATYGVEGTIIPTPGHTNGSLSIILSTGECFIGDLVMGMVPASRPRLPVFAEDAGSAPESIRKVLAMNPKILYTGHGGPFLPEQLRNLVG